MKPGVQIITPNRDLGNGYLSFFSAWARSSFVGVARASLSYVAQLYKKCRVLDSGARGATTTFASARSAMCISPGRTRRTWRFRGRRVSSISSIRRSAFGRSLTWRSWTKFVDRKKHGPRGSVIEILVHGCRAGVRSRSTSTAHERRNPEEAGRRFRTSGFSQSRRWQELQDAHKEFIGAGGVVDSIYKAIGRYVYA